MFNLKFHKKVTYDLLLIITDIVMVITIQKNYHSDILYIIICHYIYKNLYIPHKFYYKLMLLIQGN